MFLWNQDTTPSAPQPLIFKAADLPALRESSTGPCLALSTDVRREPDNLFAFYRPVECSSSFWLESAVTGQPVPYQVTLASSKALGTLPFESIRFDLDGQPSVTVAHDPSAEPSQVQLIQLKSESPKGYLRWREDDVVVFSGAMTSSSAAELKVCPCPLCSPTVFELD